MKKTDLFNDFDSISPEEWKEKIIADLKGKDFDDTLVWEDEAGIKHAPFYAQHNNTSNELLNAVQNIQKKNQKWKYIEDSSKSNFIDPIGDCIESKSDYNKVILSLNATLKKHTDTDQSDRFLLVNGGIYKNAGANIVEELAYILHHLTVYLDHLIEIGATEETIEKSLLLRLDFGTSYFSEVAKGRAFRFLFQQVVQSYGLNIQPQIWGEGSSYSQAHIDAHTNLLRLSSQCMSAILGNCDLIGLPAFDALGGGSSFGKRMSENITHILKEESFFEQVSDMSAGSYYIENLTTEIAQKAWSLFLEIEKEGGLKEQVTSGKLEIVLNDSHQKREKQYQEGKKSMVGVNKYLNEGGKTLQLKDTPNTISNAPLSSNIH